MLHKSWQTVRCDHIPCINQLRSFANWIKKVICLYRISKATNFRPKQWTQKWTIVQRPFSQSPYGSTKGQTGNQNANAKGKLHKIKRKWRWGAGAGWTILSVLDWWLLAAGGWLSWQGAVLRWTPLGVALVAAAQWHLHNRECQRKGLPRTAPHWQVKC